MKSRNFLTTNAFIHWLKESDINQGHIINLDGEIHVSSSLPKTLSNHIVSLPDYANHEVVVFKLDVTTNALFVVAVHRTNRGLAQGGTRFKQYEAMNDLFTDVLRLSKGMTEKNSLAELWWGGGKSIIHPVTMPVNYIDRVRIFENFGKFIASLNGVYVCAEDMNTTPEDMRVIHAHNRFCTCIPSDIGGSSNPSIFTAKGVFQGMLAGINFLDGVKNSNDLSGKHILIEGLGNVGFHVLKQVVNAGAKVSVFEPNSLTVEKVKSIFSSKDINFVNSSEELYKIKADVFSPNAIGATVNPTSINRLDVKLVVGAANNQLQNAVRDAKALQDKGIVYVPDFAVNCMGIINCANEQYGYIPSEIARKLDDIYPRIYSLLEDAQKDNISPQFKAIEKADELSKINHPILGHRGKKIIYHFMNKKS